MGERWCAPDWRGHFGPPVRSPAFAHTPQIGAPQDRRPSDGPRAVISWDQRDILACRGAFTPFGRRVRSVRARLRPRATEALRKMTIRHNENATSPEISGIPERSQPSVGRESARGDLRRPCDPSPIIRFLARNQTLRLIRAETVSEPVAISRLGVRFARKHCIF